MNLPPKAIEEFRQLWLTATGEVIDFEEAGNQAQKLLSVLYATFTDEPTI